MNTLTPEVANALIDQLVEEIDPQWQSPTSEESVRWERKRSLRWIEFLKVMENYCRARHWEISYDSPSDFSLAIFAHDDQGEDEADELQERLPFDGDDTDFIPF